MNGGKSTLMLQTAYSASSRGFSVIVVGYKGNSRESTIRSRLGVELEPDFLFDEKTRLKQRLSRIIAQRGRCNVLEVLIDEAQFLTPKQVEDLLRFTIGSGVDVKCFGLKTNFETRAFPGSLRLLELADELNELNLVKCRCGQKASVNARFDSSSGELISSGPEQLIEGSDQEIIYDPVCARCFIEHGGSFSK